MNPWFMLQFPLGRRATRGLVYSAAVCFAAAIAVAAVRPLPPAINDLLWISLCAFGILLLIPVLFPKWVQWLCNIQEEELQKKPSEQIGRWVP
jgi:hypothetical protein